MSQMIHPVHHEQVGSRDFEQLSPTSSAQRRLKKNYPSSEHKRTRESKPKGKNTASGKSDKESPSFLEAVTNERDACQAELAALKLKDSSHTQAQAEDKNILDILEDHEGFHAFLAAVSTVSSLKETLLEDGPFTVFGKIFSLILFFVL